MRPTAPARPSLRKSGGYVLLYAVFAVFVIASLIIAGTQRTESLSAVSALEFNAEGQARQVAESGLVDALSWLRRQPMQPVTEFTPARDLTADPPIDETDDPAIGLVRSFEIAPGIWAQYVVRRGRPAEPFTDRNGNGIFDEGEPFQDLDRDGRRTQALGARDVTDRNGGVAAGAVWHLECEGRIFERSRADLELDRAPNRQLAVATLATEVRRHVVGLAASAALLAGNGKKAELKDGLITSPVLGIAYREGTGKPKVGGKGGVQAPTKDAPVPGWENKGKKEEDNALTPEEVFGVDMDTLKAMADITVGGLVPPKPVKVKKDRLATTIPEDTMVVVTPWIKNEKKKGKVKFDKKLPLTGSGILIVDGDVEIKKDALADFTGILYVTGKLRVDKSARIVGTVIAGQEAKLKGSASKAGPGEPVIAHDLGVVTHMLNKMGQYRRTKASFQRAPLAPDEHPLEELLVFGRHSPSPGVPGSADSTGAQGP